MNIVCKLIGRLGEIPVLVSFNHYSRPRPILERNSPENKYLRSHRYQAPPIRTNLFSPMSSMMNIKIVKVKCVSAARQCNSHTLLKLKEMKIQTWQAILLIIHHIM